MSENELPPAGAEGQEPQDAQETAQQAHSQDAARYDAEYVQQLRREAAGYRKRLRELEETVRQFEAEKLTESERLQRRLQELEAQHTAAQQALQERTLRYEVMLAASKYGIVDPDAAYRLLDMAALEFGEDGRPQNLDKALRTLVQERPYLLGSSGGVSATNPARSGALPVFKRSQLRDPAFFQEHRDEIMRAFREGRIEED
jgi:ATPase subunit of ABC transporter with duplicated ATPase domains